MAENSALLLLAAVATIYGILDSRRSADRAIYTRRDTVRFRTLRGIRWPCTMTFPALVYGSFAAFAGGDARTSGILLTAAAFALALPSEIVVTQKAVELRVVRLLVLRRIPLAQINEAILIPGADVVEIATRSGRSIRHTPRHVDRRGFMDCLRRRGVTVLEQGF